MRKRRLEVVVETKRRFTLRKSDASPTTLCGQCSGPLLRVGEATAVTGLSSRAIHRLVEAGEVHFEETPAGALLICPNSFVVARAEAGQSPSPDVPKAFP